MESNEFNWSLFDYLVAGALILMTVLIITLVIKRVDKRFRWPAIMGAVVLIVLIWAELAVGIFGTPFAGS